LVRVVVAVVAERPVLAHLVVAEQLRLQAPLAVVARLLLQRQPALLVALEVAAERKVLPQEAEVAAALLLVQGLAASESLRRR
jgi:hypothetical protein